MELLSLIILICLVPFWYAIGQGCSSLLRLPSLTGYIFGGIICGPHVSAILQQQHLGNVTFIEHACLSYIAFLAGAELHLGGIKRIRRQMTWMVAGISFFSWAFVFLCALLASSKTPFLATLPRGQILAVCNLLGVLALARSPASAVSVIHEIKGSGPYCSLVMAIVIVKDVLVFLLFSLALNAAEQVRILDQINNKPSFFTRRLFLSKFESLFLIFFLCRHL
jgi:Kef-type K+ transport system membrane component KefB